MNDRKLVWLVSAVLLLLVCAVGVQTYQIVQLNQRLNAGGVVVASAPGGQAPAARLDVALTPTPTPGPVLEPPAAQPVTADEEEEEAVADGGTDLQVAPPADNDGSFATPAPNQQAQIPMPVMPDPIQRMRQMDRMIQAMMD